MLWKVFSCITVCMCFWWMRKRDICDTISLKFTVYTLHGYEVCLKELLYRDVVRVSGQKV